MNKRKQVDEERTGHIYRAMRREEENREERKLNQSLKRINKGQWINTSDPDDWDLPDDLLQGD